MKIIVFSDIHGNFEPINLMLAREKNVDIYIFAGDTLGYYFEELEVLNLLTTLNNCILVKGNHEGFYEKLNDNPSQEFREKLVSKYGKVYESTNPIILSYIRKLPYCREICLLKKRILIVHGSPEDPLNGRIYPSDDIKENLKYDIIILGNTHYRLRKQVGKTLYLNPGSIGQPRDGGGFSYCVLSINEDHIKTEFKEVQIDLGALSKTVLQYYNADHYAYRILNRRGIE